jgi:2-polyprenyl-6-methoxyphenol hydroxylase-like FAD-dependent oxidoreductase
VFLDGRTLQAPVEPPAASISRLDLDAALWDSAEQCGVDGRQQVAVQTISGTGPFLVRTPGGEFESRALVNASGRWSNVNAEAHVQNGDAKWLGLKGHFAESSPLASADLYFFISSMAAIVEYNP